MCFTLPPRTGVCARSSSATSNICVGGVWTSSLLSLGAISSGVWLAVVELSLPRGSWDGVAPPDGVEGGGVADTVVSAVGNNGIAVALVAAAFRDCARVTTLFVCGGLGAAEPRFIFDRLRGPMLTDAVICELLMCQWRDAGRIVPMGERF